MLRNMRRGLVGRTSQDIINKPAATCASDAQQGGRIPVFGQGALIAHRRVILCSSPWSGKLDLNAHVLIRLKELLHRYNRFDTYNVFSENGAVKQIAIQMGLRICQLLPNLMKGDNIISLREAFGVY